MIKAISSRLSSSLKLRDRSKTSFAKKTFLNCSRNSFSIKTFVASTKRGVSIIETNSRALILRDQQYAIVVLSKSLLLTHLLSFFKSVTTITSTFLFKQIALRKSSSSISSTLLSSCHFSRVDTIDILSFSIVASLRLLLSS